MGKEALCCVRAAEKSTWADEGKAGLGLPAVSVGCLGGSWRNACLPGLNSIIQRMQAWNYRRVLGNVDTQVTFRADPRKRLTLAVVPPLQIPALAVEMPGSADISGLNLQFGALQFGSEPVLAEYESTPTTSAAVSQSQSSLYTSTAR